MPRDAGRCVDQQLVLRVPPAIPRSGSDPPSAGDHVGKVDVQTVGQIAFAEMTVGEDGRAGYRVRLDQVSIGLEQIVGGGWILCGSRALLRVEGAANRGTRHQNGGNPSTRRPSWVNDRVPHALVSLHAAVQRRAAESAHWRSV